MESNSDNQEVLNLKSQIEEKTLKLNNLKTQKATLKKLRHLSDLKVIYKYTYEDLKEDEKLIDKLISEKSSIIKSLSKKIECLERSKKIDENISKIFSDKNQAKITELENYVNKTKSFSSLEESKRIDKIIENLRIIKPCYREYERLEQIYKSKLEELGNIQKINKDKNERLKPNISSYLLVFAMLVLVLNIVLSHS